jgi:hypothetical protein
VFVVCSAEFEGLDVVEGVGSWLAADGAVGLVGEDPSA